MNQNVVYVLTLPLNISCLCPATALVCCHHTDQCQGVVVVTGPAVWSCVFFEKINSLAKLLNIADDVDLLYKQDPLQCIVTLSHPQCTMSTLHLSYRYDYTNKQGASPPATSSRYCQDPSSQGYSLECWELDNRKLIQYQNNYFHDNIIWCTADSNWWNYFIDPMSGCCKTPD